MYSNNKLRWCHGENLVSFGAVVYWCMRLSYISVIGGSCVSHRNLVSQLLGGKEVSASICDWRHVHCMNLDCL